MATVTTTQSFTLFLTREEALWLKGILQNPLWVQDPADEAEHDRTHRASLWGALSQVNDHPPGTRE